MTPWLAAPKSSEAVIFHLSGLMNKHIVKHFWFQDLVGLVGLMPLGALYPSKSGLMNKHIVKHSVPYGCTRNASVGVPCARLSPD